MCSLNTLCGDNEQVMFEVFGMSLHSVHANPGMTICRNPFKDGYCVPETTSVCPHIADSRIKRQLFPKTALTVRSL